MKRITIILLLCLASAAVAQAPRTMNFQGTLADGGGTTLPDASYNLTFRLWDADVGGSILWTEARVVTVDAGIFTVVLGETTPLLLPFDQPYWLGVQVGGDAELSPRSPLTAMPYAMNVADGAVVQSLNGRVDDLSIVGGANITVNTVGNDIIINGTGALTDADWNVVGNDMTSIPVGNVGIGAAVPISKLQVVGDVTAGDDATAGGFLAETGFGPQSIIGGAYFSAGSEIQLREETGFTHLYAQPDFDGTGGFFQVTAGPAGQGFVVDGNYNSTGSARISMSGASSGAFFRTDLAGNDAVVLPVDAVYANEILDEPGVASNLATGPIKLSTSYGALVSQTIVCPTAGYVYVQATAEVDILHTNGTSSFSTMGVSENATTLPSNQDQSFYLPSNAVSGTYLTSHSPSGMFEVTAGAHTFYLVARSSNASVDIDIWDMQLNCIFFPTAYGGVTSTKSGQADVDQFSGKIAPAPAPSAADLAAERADSEAFARDRVDRELAAMRRQLEQLQSEVDQMNGADGSR
ncbi:MAG: hypothetical protein GY838_16465 [bacterium]|nr:hypothetical protein [bacterium]